MEHEEIQAKLDELEKKIDAIYTSSEKVRKYFLAILWITIILFVLPLIGMIFVIPQFLDVYMTSFEGLI